MKNLIQDIFHTWSKNNGGNSVYYAVGGDFGVDFFTACFPEQEIVV